MPVRNSVNSSAGRSPLRTKSQGRKSNSPTARSSVHQPRMNLEMPTYATGPGIEMQRSTSPLRNKSNPVADHLAEMVMSSG